MELYLVFNSVLIFLVVGVLFFIFRFIFSIETLNKEAAKQVMSLEAKMKKENKKLKINNEKVLIIDNLNQILFNRLAKISTDFLSLKEFIFDKES